MKGVPGAPSFLSPLSWTHAGDDTWTESCPDSLLSPAAVHNKSLGDQGSMRGMPSQSIKYKLLSLAAEMEALETENYDLKDELRQVRMRQQERDVRAGSNTDPASASGWQPPKSNQARNDSDIVSELKSPIQSQQSTLAALDRLDRKSVV